ncbi:MAG: 50S ribosomal protein L11 methyltransferase [Parvibaculaceae bacterium]
MFIARSKPMAKDEAERLSDLLTEADEPEALSVSATEIDEARSLWQVEAHYQDAAAEGALAAAGVEFLGFEPVPDVDWVALSLAGLAPVIAGRFIVHGGHDREKLRPGGVPIEIEAGMAFGTGHHGTTRACLLALDRLLKQRRPARVLDVGSGSGVLGIAAALAASARVRATDIDPEAVWVTAANARLNRVGALVEARLASPRDFLSGRYDLVFANVLAGPLIAMSLRLGGVLARGGTIVLSGILREQARSVAGAYLARGLTLKARIALGEWTTLVLERP